MRSGNTGYTPGMAKVMVSLPDDLLRAVDVEAGRRGTTRSAYLRELAEETLRRRSIRRAERMAEIDDMAGHLAGHGGGGPNGPGRPAPNFNLLFPCPQHPSGEGGPRRRAPGSPPPIARRWRSVG